MKGAGYMRMNKFLIICIMPMALLLSSCARETVVYPSNVSHDYNELVGTWKFAEKYIEINELSNMYRNAELQVYADGSFVIDWNTYGFTGEFSSVKGTYTVDETVVFVPISNEYFKTIELTIDDEAECLYYIIEKSSLFGMTMEIIPVLEKK